MSREGLRRNLIELYRKYSFHLEEREAKSSRININTLRHPHENDNILEHLLNFRNFWSFNDENKDFKKDIEWLLDNKEDLSLVIDLNITSPCSVVLAFCMKYCNSIAQIFRERGISLTLGAPNHTKPQSLPIKKQVQLEIWEEESSNYWESEKIKVFSKKAMDPAYKKLTENSESILDYSEEPHAQIAIDFESYIELYISLAKAYERAGYPEFTIEIYKFISYRNEFNSAKILKGVFVKNHYNLKAYEERAILEYKLFGIDKALIILFQASFYNPKNSRAAYNLGMAYVNDERDEDAVKYFEEATNIDPNNMLALLRTGDCYLRLEQTKGHYLIASAAKICGKIYFGDEANKLLTARIYSNHMYQNITNEELEKSTERFIQKYSDHIKERDCAKILQEIIPIENSASKEDSQRNDNSDNAELNISADQVQNEPLHVVSFHEWLGISCTFM